MTRSYFHVHRVFHVDTPKDDRGGWYFEVRDGPPHGPYAFQVLAEIALEGYLGGSVPNRHMRNQQRQKPGSRPKASAGGNAG